MNNNILFANNQIRKRKFSSEEPKWKPLKNNKKTH